MSITLNQCLQETHTLRFLTQTSTLQVYSKLSFLSCFLVYRIVACFQKKKTDAFSTALTTLFPAYRCCLPEFETPVHIRVLTRDLLSCGCRTEYFYPSCLWFLCARTSTAGESKQQQPHRQQGRPWVGRKFGRYPFHAKALLSMIARFEVSTHTTYSHVHLSFMQGVFGYSGLDTSFYPAHSITPSAGINKGRCVFACLLPPPNSL